MRLYIKYDINTACRKIVQDHLDKLNLTYSMVGFGEVEVEDSLSPETLKGLNGTLEEYGIEILDNHKNIMVQKIKDVINEMVYSDEKLPNAKNSAYLADKLNMSYWHISNLFSEVTYTSIENFIILQKVERAKLLMSTNELTFTEIAWKLNYSSVAHFSAQFKNATGLTPSSFQRILNKRRAFQQTEL